MSPCMALYCMGVMCSKPGGGTSQYFLTFFFFSRCGERLQDEDKTGKIKKKKNNIKHLSLKKQYTRNSNDGFFINNSQNSFGRLN